MKKPFRRHFRIYFRNGHPAYIIDEEGNMFVFHRVTHSKKSGGRNNLKINNPLLKGGTAATYIVKKEEKDRKGRFSLFELELKPDVDISDLGIKKAGGSQTNQGIADVVNNVTTSKYIKTKTRKRRKKNKRD